MKYHMNGITSMMLALSVLAGCTAGRPIADISERQTAATATAENRMIKELKAIPSSYAENASEQGRVV